jgi:hypothetical protein
MQEVRRFKPSTVSRQFSVAAGFYRTFVLDGLIEHSPAEHVRRPAVPAESPTLGFTHLQFEALLTVRDSANPCHFALVAMLGLLGLRIFEATGANIADLGEEHGQRVLRVCGKGTKVVLVPLPPAVGRARPPSGYDLPLAAARSSYAHLAGVDPSVVTGCIRRPGYAGPRSCGAGSCVSAGDWAHPTAAGSRP